MTPARARCTPALLLSIGSLCAPSAAQGLLHELVAAPQGFGVAVAAVGDLDIDGFDDVAVGSSRAGIVWVYSGKSGALLFTLLGNAGDSFGHAIAPAGDFDQDGFPDIFVGAPQLGPGQNRRGYAELYSGRRGGPGIPPMLQVVGEASGDAFGFAIASGDLDGDEFTDFVFGAPQIGAGVATGPGFVLVGSAVFGTVLRGRVNGDAFGFAVAMADVLDGKGDDMIVGAPQGPLAATASGYVQLIPGNLTGAVTTIGLATPGALLGHAVAAADVDGDGLRDPILGAPQFAFGGAFAGRVSVFPRAAGAQPITIHGTPGDQLGFALARVGDTDGDGVEEFVAGAPQFDPVTGAGAEGYARVFSGATALFTVSGKSARDAFGFAVAGAGDVNGNGLSDLIVGAPQGFPFASTGSGYARIYSGTCGGVVAFGAGCPGSGGIVPSLTAGGCATPGGDVALSIDGALGGSVAALLLGTGRGSFPIGGGCQLLLAPLFPVVLGPLPLAGSGPGGGSATAPIAVPFTIPSPVSLTLQAFALDPGALVGLSSTGGLEVNVR